MIALKYIYKCVCFALLVIATLSCGLSRNSNQLPECNPQLRLLMVSNEVFPSGWTAGLPTKDDEYSMGAIDSCLLSFYTFNGSAGQEILRFENEDEAIHGYKALLELFSPEASKEIPAPSFVSRAADDLYLACSIPKDTPICEVISRYGQFVVDFQTHFRAEFMTEDDLVRILKAIDEKMMQVETKK